MIWAISEKCNNKKCKISEKPLICSVFDQLKEAGDIEFMTLFRIVSASLS